MTYTKLPLENKGLTSFFPSPALSAVEGFFDLTPYFLRWLHQKTNEKFSNFPIFRS